MRFFSILLSWWNLIRTELSFKQEDDERLISLSSPANMPANTNTVILSVYLFSIEETYYIVQYSYINSTIRFQLYDYYNEVKREISESRADIIATEERTTAEQTWKYNAVCYTVNTSTNEPFKIAVETSYGFVKDAASCRKLYPNNPPHFLL